MSYLKFKYAMAKYEVRRRVEKAWFAFVWCLPRTLIYFAAIRLIAYGTSGKYGATSPNDLNVMEALKRWE